MKEHLDQPTDIRAGEALDTTALTKYLKTHLPDLSGHLEMGQFPSGFSNLTYFLQVGNLEMVLRRPPFGAKVKSGHDMHREYTILQALSKHWDKAPKPFLYCDDEAVIGAPFYLMERVRGRILRGKMTNEEKPSKTEMKAIAHSLVDTLVELHQLDYEAAGLGDLGRPEGYVERQITGWTKRYFKAKTDDVQPIEKAAQWLADHLPPSAGHALIHNDFKYDNLVLDLDDPSKVKAVLDWEMSTLGDPLMDLGTSLGYWVNANDPDWLKQLALSPTTLAGNPTRSEIVEWYAQKRDQSVDQVVFYYVYGLFKVAVIVQQIYYRYKHGHTQDPRFASLNKAVKGLGAMAMQAIQKGRIDDLF